MTIPVMLGVDTQSTKVYNGIMANDGLRVLACGDRNWFNKESIRTILSSFIISVLIEGEARGADSLARDVAIELGIPVKKYPANWKKFPRAAGHIRNKQMLVEGKPDLVIAFHSDLKNSKGTKHMVEIAHKAGVSVFQVTY